MIFLYSSCIFFKLSFLIPFIEAVQFKDTSAAQLLQSEDKLFFNEITMKQMELKLEDCVVVYKLPSMQPISCFKAFPLDNVPLGKV